MLGAVFCLRVCFFSFFWPTPGVTCRQGIPTGALRAEDTAMRSDQLHAPVSHARFGGKRCTQAAPVSKSSLLPAGLRVTAQRERFTHRCRFPSASELVPQAPLWIRVFQYHAPLSITLGIGIGSAGSPLQPA